jgi:4-carboxymuconolactone decarboxylase
MVSSSTHAHSIAALPFDPVAREAEILGKPQRLEPLESHEFNADAQAYADEMNAAKGNKPGTEIYSLFRLFFRHPLLFRRTMDMTAQLMDKGELSAREREMAIIRVTWLCGAPNPYGEHVEVGRTIGLSEDELRRLTIGSAARGWSDHERNLLKAVDELWERQAVSDEVWDALALVWTDKQQIEFPAVVSQYIASSIMHNTLRTRISERNKGLAQFAD